MTGLVISSYIICTGCPAIARTREDRLNASDERVGYGQFCPVAMAAEIICSRWTALVVRELICGSTRFNDIRRGVPRMSPTLLSKRLKELAEAGVIVERATGRAGPVEYKLTQAGEELRDVIMSMGTWGQRWIETSISLKNLDPSLLMWDMRRNLAPTGLPERRCTVQFVYPELGAGRKTWWLVVDSSGVDLCSVDPGHEVNLHVHSSLRSMTSVWMGITTLKQEIDAGHIEVTGDKAIARSMHSWLGLSPFAKEKSRLAG
jgi:DNA-binding HxlR family transcriptional regulator